MSIYKLAAHVNRLHKRYVYAMYASMAKYVCSPATTLQRASIFNKPALDYSNVRGCESWGG